MTSKTEDNKPLNNSQQEAAANLMRSKLGNIYDKEETSQPYNKTHLNHVAPQAEQFKRYHSAWQDYYKKYYQSYYAAQTDSNKVTDEQTATPDETIHELKDKLLKQVSESANKVKKSKHFIPILSGLLVVILILFVQYNSLIIGKFMAFISPGSLDSQNIIVDPNTIIEVGPEPRLIIPKINVDAPVNYGIGNDHDSLMAGMTNGIAHFAIPGANSRPGQKGNTVLSGHSSNDLFDTGNYKFIFVQLERVEKGDIIYTHYESKRYTYIVTKKEVVGPNEVDKLIYPTDKPVLTLITCVPIGTANSRLLVTAEQISPDPKQATATPIEDQIETNLIPGKQPSLIERLFNLTSY